MTNLIKEFNREDITSPLFKKSYEEDGCVVVRQLANPALVSSLRERLIGFFKSTLSNIPDEDDNYLDTLHQKAEKELGDERAKYLLTIGKDLPAFKHLISSKEILAAVSSLLKTEEIQSADDNNVLRIDRPNSELTNLPWHQDYPYNMLTQNAPTAWIPLTPVTADMGKPQFVLPRDELYPVEYSESTKQQFHNSRYIRMKSLETLTVDFDKRAIEAPDMSPGDVLFIHALVVHKSGNNLSNRSRWVATARYGSLVDPQMKARNWFTMRAKYPDLFKHIHPDLFELVD